MMSDTAGVGLIVLLLVGGIWMYQQQGEFQKEAAKTHQAQTRMVVPGQGSGYPFPATTQGWQQEFNRVQQEQMQQIADQQARKFRPPQPIRLP
jgi:hypothetical protein